jgi:rhodanese-related sulfurtransferase
MRTLASDPTLIPQDREVVLVCHVGGRSDHLAAYLTARGYANVRSLRGGVEAWASEIDPTMARY